MAAPVRAKLQTYKDVATPLTHRRFTDATAVALLLCYVEAILIGEISSTLWFWFPFGSVGVRTLLLFISAMPIFVLHVGQLHIGARTTSSPFETFRKYLIRYNTLQTLFWYFFSAWWFSEVYVWSAPKSANLAWISDAKAHERPRLNERPIFLRSTFYILALIQSFLHLYYDYDRLSIPETNRAAGSTSPNAPNRLGSPLEQLKTTLPRRIQAAFLRSLSMIVIGPVVYTTFMRKYAWSWTLYFAKVFRSLPRSSSMLPTIPPFSISMLFRSFTSTFALLLLWELSSTTFSAFTAQIPLKNDRPLTDGSKDPNGTLLIGLRAKRDLPRLLALWELTHISQNVPDRRKTIFEDIDRKGGATWTQIFNLNLDVVQGINSRIAAELNPPQPAPAPVQPPSQQNPQPLPRLTAPLREGNIFTASPPPATRPEMVQNTMGTLAKSYGQAPAPSRGVNKITPQVKRMIEFGVDKTLTPEQRHALSKQGRVTALNTYLRKFLESPLGIPFRETLRRRAAAVVLGTPFGEPSFITDAVESLTSLAIASLKEDDFGKVSSDVPTIIRIFVNTINNLELLKSAMKPHWTDVEESSPGYREKSLIEANMIQATLKSALRRLINDFGNYADVLGLGKREMRMATEAAGVAVEKNAPLVSEPRR